MQKSEIDNKLVAKALSYDSDDPSSMCCSNEHLVCVHHVEQFRQNKLLQWENTQ